MYELEPGSGLGKYQIVRKLADGGMAEIYLATIGGTAGFEKHVVVKRIKPTFAEDRAQIGMFLDEARLAATLRHANIAEVIDVGFAGDAASEGSSAGSYYFAMEYILGQDARNLRHACEDAGRPIPLEVALAIISGTTAALAYAHDKAGPDGPLGLVHRDVSPSNILVSYDGAVKLVDFGIARATSRTTKTLTGILKGKVPYMSPEQCRGKVLDRRSDLFSLGIVLYELTTGSRPFSGRTEYDTLEQIAVGTPTPPSAVDPDYAPDLEAIVMRLLERDVTLRYQSADEVLADLDRLGVFVSTLNVRKFMHEVFAADIRSTTSRTFIVDPEQWSPDDETTAAFDRRVKRYVEPMRKRAPTSGVTSTGRAPTEVTHTDAAPFDPLEYFGDQLLAELDVDAPADEANDARLRRRIDTLVDRAFACYGADELDMAIAAVELAMNEDGGSPAAQRFAHQHRDTIRAILQAFIGHPGQVPRLSQARAMLEAQPRLQRSSFLMARIDGHVNIEELVHTSGLSPIETYRQLCTLIVRGAVELDPPR